ncbi:MAG TPA: hypothetical protein VKK79_16020, partial [Candidatus Lokiarchaeia archaeon]|nr:hypothetical protein [Candidatus Lokiarchaeia archaeon]
MKNGTAQEVKVDREWAQDWLRIVAVYDAIEKLETAFADLEPELTYLRVLTQKQLILNLEKYAWSLQALIVSKYR